MDMNQRKQLWFEDEKRAQGEAFIRHLERKARWRNWLRFVFNWRQVVDDPVAAVSASEGPLPMLPSGADTGAAGFRDVTSTHALTPLASGSRLPGGPHL